MNNFEILGKHRPTIIHKIHIHSPHVKRGLNTCDPQTPYLVPPPPDDKNGWKCEFDEINTSTVKKKTLKLSPPPEAEFSTMFKSINVLGKPTHKQNGLRWL